MVQIVAPVETVGDLSSEDDSAGDSLTLQPRSVSFSEGPRFRPRRQLSLVSAESSPSLDRRGEVIISFILIDQQYPDFFNSFTLVFQ